VAVSLTRDTAEAILSVADTGRGIPAEHLPYLFERFYRADLARGRDNEGAGLGLSIAKALPEAHGGTISVASVVDAGPTVRVRLPLAERGNTVPELSETS